MWPLVSLEMSCILGLQKHIQEDIESIHLATKNEVSYLVKKINL
jgi:hypothetical protein